MKTIIENMITMIVLTMMVFVLSGILTIEQQIINARNYHSQIIEKLQNIDSYENDAFNNFRKRYANDRLTIMVDEDKKSAEVKYIFDINVPLIGTIEKNTITGYAR